MNSKTISLCCAIFFCLLSSQSAASGSNGFKVAVASNFLMTLKKLRLDFVKKTGISFSISAASTGKLYAQIRYGAPYDIFFSADEKRADLLFKQGIATTPIVYAEGKIALLANKNIINNCNSSIGKVLTNTKIKRFSIANPKTAPYGVAAEQLIRSYSKWSELTPKLVRGENILQSLQYIMTGSAEAGIVAKSLLIDLKESALYCDWDIPRKRYKPIKQKMVLLNNAKGNKAVDLFYDYMKSNAAKGIIKSNGYYVE